MRHPSEDVDDWVDQCFSLPIGFIMGLAVVIAFGCLNAYIWLSQRYGVK